MEEMACSSVLYPACGKKEKSVREWGIGPVPLIWREKKREKKGRKRNVLRV